MKQTQILRINFTIKNLSKKSFLKILFYKTKKLITTGHKLLISKSIITYVSIKTKIYEMKNLCINIRRYLTDSQGWSLSEFLS